MDKICTKVNKTSKNELWGIYILKLQFRVSVIRMLRLINYDNVGLSQNLIHILASYGTYPAVGENTILNLHLLISWDILSFFASSNYDTHQASYLLNDV